MCCSLSLVNPKLAILDPEDHKDYEFWLSVWDAWEDKEIFAHPDYVRLFSEGIGVPRCAILQSEYGSVLYPFILRTIDTDARTAPPLTDIISPYGFGGWFAWQVAKAESLIQLFDARFTRWASENGVVSEFIRFSVQQSGLLKHPSTPILRMQTIVRSLIIPEQEIWRDYDAKVRKNVQKALRNNVHVEFDTIGNTTEDFMRIYDSTMDRRSAASSYRFSQQFFDRLNTALAGHFVYANAVYQGRIISTELVLVSAKSVYSFLGGTDSSYFEVRPNDLLKHEIALWAKRHAKTSYVLGGGYESDDGIFRYKKAFAPSGIVPFFTGERVLMAEEYGDLVDKRMKSLVEAGETWDPSTDFFPKYRAG